MQFGSDDFDILMIHVDHNPMVLPFKHYSFTVLECAVFTPHCKVARYRKFAQFYDMNFWYHQANRVKMVIDARYCYIPKIQIFLN